MPWTAGLASHLVVVEVLLCWVLSLSFLLSQPMLMWHKRLRPHDLRPSGKVFRLPTLLWLSPFLAHGRHDLQDVMLLASIQGAVA